MCFFRIKKITQKKKKAIRKTANPQCLAPNELLHELINVYYNGCLKNDNDY